MQRWNIQGPGTTRVSLAAGAAGPIGGDHLRLDIEVGPGAALILRTVAASLLLPGPHGRPSSSEVAARVAAGGTLVWLPEPVIAARGCDHRAATRISLEPGARLLLREELLLGRHGEQPGTVHQRLRVTVGDGPLHDQELHLGPRAPGWDGPAVTGGRRALGSLLLVDPDGAPPIADRLPRAGVDASGAAASGAALMPLTGPAVLLTALADEALTLRRQIDSALAVLDHAPPPAGATVGAGTRSMPRSRGQAHAAAMGRGQPGKFS